MSDFTMKRTCAECPWLRSTTPGKFSPERYAALQETATQQYGAPVFGCHMAPDNKIKACAGFMLVEGLNNINVRIAAARQQFSFDDIKAAGPLYDSYEELARANGLDLEDFVR